MKQLGPYIITEAESYSPPQAARNNAKKVLKWKEEHGNEVKAMTATGWARANQLASGEKLSLETVKRMAAFERHRSNAKIDPKHKSEPWKDNGYVAWLGWGGSAGINWAKSIVSKLDEAEQQISEGKKDYEIYHRTFSSALDEVLAFVKKNGYEVSEDEWFNSVTTGPKRPAEGITNRYNFNLYKADKLQRKTLSFQIYGMKTQWELNMYIA